MYNELKDFERVVTPNRRLASFLNKQLCQTLPEKQFYVGKVLAWQDFLQDCWQEFRPDIQQNTNKRLLSTWQSHLIWQAVIAENDYDMPLLDTAETVHLSKQAHGLLQQWCYDTDKLEGIKADTDLFLLWRKAYQQQLQDKSAIDESDISQSVKAILPNIKANKLPTQIYLYGFDALTPEQKQLFAAFEKQGVVVTQAALPGQAEKITRHQYKTIKDEMTTIAQQIKQALAQENKPRLPYGVVVPQLSEHWRLINDVFVEAFSPYQHLPTALDTNLPFNISAGLPLYEVPIIQAAWVLFDLLQDSPKLNTWTQLCRSPFISAGITEMSVRAKFELKLRRTQQNELSWAWVLAQKHLPVELAALLKQADALIKNKPKQAKAAAWQSWLLQWLQHWGWPGERNLNSEEYQAATHFYRLLNDLTTLDTVCENSTLSYVLGQLRSQALQRMFQPESEDKPVQILGMLEAAGQQFEKLWITGLSHDVWPQKPSPNPFIPTHVQVKEEMPHASAQREMVYAETMLQRLLTASKEVQLSYAEFDLDSDSARLPSPLILSYPQEKTQTTLAAETIVTKLQQTNDIEDLPATEGLPLANSLLKGGAGIFKDQAACPFRAYAKYRLQAVAPELPILGISPKIKGILLHRVLETLWADLQTQANLQALSESELQNLCEQHMEQALREINPRLSVQQEALEQRRAMPLLLAWLQLEKARDTFSIKGLETAKEVVLADLPLNLRIDRIDQLPDGSFLLIDYKTGDVKTKSWLGLRPDEPQLPLYVSLMATPPEGIAFAVLRKKKIEFLRLNRENTDWEQQLQEWRTAIEQLAFEFCDGRADLAPKYGAQTCQQCDLQLFCRVNEL